MTAFDFLKGDHDYRAAAEQKATDAEGRPEWPTVEQQLTRLRAEYDSLASKYAELQHDHTTLAEKHADIFARFDVIAHDTNETQYLRDRIRRELVNHLEEWNAS